MFLKRLGTFFLDILEVLVFAVAIFLFFYLLILQPHKIKGDSMQPNYPNGEYLLTDKVSYRFGEPKRGDVIVFKAPSDNGEEFIKRILGLPGENVMVKEGKIWINSKAVSEDYLAKDVITYPGAFLGEGETKIVPANEFFVLGDNRPHSSDSRTWGFVPKGNITGKAWFIYWPPQSFGGVPKVGYSL